jgi:hypothetical protein
MVKNGVSCKSWKFKMRPVAKSVKTEKKSYVEPQLKVFGTVSDLTGAGTGTKSEATGAGSKQRYQ